VSAPDILRQNESGRVASSRFERRFNAGKFARRQAVTTVDQRAGKRVKLTRGAQVHADSGEKR
jgi:hypothetical protein